jgi:glycosyltransferase
MKISIITVCYNSEKTIYDAINSINLQTYPNIEHVFIDGLSTDETLDVIKINSKRDNIIISEPDKGIYDALNKGILNATGDIIGFLHSDDVLNESNTIEDIVNTFNIESVDGVYGDLLYVDKQNINKIIRNWKSCIFEKELLNKGWMPPHPTLFLKKNIYHKYGLFDLNYSISSDYEFILRIFKNKSLKFTYIPNVISKMRIGGASNRNIKNIINKTIEDYRALKSNNTGNLFSLIRKNTSKIKQFFIN